VTIRVGVKKRVGSVTEGEHCVGDTVGVQRSQNTLDHRSIDDREHLLGSRKGEGLESGTETADQHHCPHGLLVGVVLGETTLEVGMSRGTVGVLVDVSRANRMIADPTITIAAIPTGKARRRLGLLVVAPPARAARATFLAEDALPIGR
jgi:hypothetical protein